MFAFERIMHYAITNDLSEVPALTDLYHLLTERLPSSARRQLEADVAMVLDSHIGQLNGLMPFMFHDPDIAVISTASLDYATLMPLKDGDPMTGPKACLDLVEAYTDNDERMAAGILAGALFLGDRRTLPLLDGCWRRLGREGRRDLTLARSQSIYASMVEFYLRWLESIEEDDFGMPVGALGRMPLDAASNPRVRDVERRFPAPYNVSPEEYETNPPITILPEWSIPEYGRLIQRRLQTLYERETYNELMPQVMAAWGLEAGQTVSADVRSHATDSKSDNLPPYESNRPASGPTREDPPDEQAQRVIEGFFSIMPPAQALAMLMATATVFAENASKLRDESARERDPIERERLAADARRRADDSAAILRRLHQQFGPDLKRALAALTKGRQAG